MNQHDPTSCDSSGKRKDPNDNDNSNNSGGGLAGLPDDDLNDDGSYRRTEPAFR